MEPDDVHALAAAFAAISEHLVDRDPSPLLTLAVQQVPGCEFASITTIVDGHGQTMAAVDDVARAADGVQHRLGAGPCMQAARFRAYHTVFPEGEGGDERWPEIARALVAETPVRSVLAVHMPEHDPTSINLYASTEHAFTRTSVAVAALIAAQAASMLSSADPRGDLRRLSESLDRQREIEVAVDILVAGGVPREDALVTLMHAARTLHHTLRSVARHVTEHGELPPT